MKDKMSTEYNGDSTARETMKYKHSTSLVMTWLVASDFKAKKE